DGVTFLATAKRRGVPRPGEANDRQIVVPGHRGGLSPGSDAGVDRLPLVVLAVEEERRNTHLREDRDGIEVHAWPGARMFWQAAPHVRELEPRLGCDRVDSALRDTTLDLPAHVALVGPPKVEDLPCGLVPVPGFARLF